MGNVKSAKSLLSIAVLGVGKIGSVFAYQLARAGHRVTVIARPGSTRLQQLRRDNCIVLKTGERADVRIADALDEQTAYDLVIVTTLSHQVDTILPALERSQAKCFHFMFVNFNPERLTTALGKQRCSFGMPFVMANLDGQGRLIPTINPKQKTLHSEQRWVDLFEGAGIPSFMEPKMMLWLRCHVPMCIAFESAALMGQRRHGGVSWAQARAVARGMRGGFEILKGLGYDLYPQMKVRLASLPIFVVSVMLFFVTRNTSMRELLAATGQNESRALIDEITNAAEQETGLATAVKAVLAVRPA